MPLSFRQRLVRLAVSLSAVLLVVGPTVVLADDESSVANGLFAEVSQVCWQTNPISTGDFVFNEDGTPVPCRQNNCQEVDPNTGDLILDEDGNTVPCVPPACWQSDFETGEVLFADDGTPMVCPVLASDFVPAPPTPPPPVQDPLQVAFDQLGKPYIWGSAGGRTDFSPFALGFDCSGFVAYVEHVAFGRYLPGSTVLAYRVTNSVPKGHEARGDVLFWNMKNPDPHIQHEALYLGDGMIIQAGGRFSNVNIDNAYAIGTPEFRRMSN